MSSLSKSHTDTITKDRDVFLKKEIALFADSVLMTDVFS